MNPNAEGESTANTYHKDKQNDPAAETIPLLLVCLHRLKRAPHGFRNFVLGVHLLSRSTYQLRDAGAAGVLCSVWFGDGVDRRRP
jgi:hypothetical protein